MKYLEKYIGKKLNDGNFILKVQPVKGVDNILLFVDPSREYIRISDGGSTFSALGTLVDFSSPKFSNHVLGICEKYKISIRNGVVFLDCTEDESEKRMNDLILAINEICIFKVL